MMSVFRQTTWNLWLGIAVSILLSTILVGCGGFGSVTPPPSPCANALVCAQVGSKADNSCVKPWGWSRTNSYWMVNHHPSRAIYVTYEKRVRHLNSLDPDQSDMFILGPIPPSKDMVLGCERNESKKPGGDSYNEWSFTPITACFDGDCAKEQLPQKPTKDRDPHLTCEQLCSKLDPSCLKYSVTNSTPEDRLVSQGLDDLTSKIASVIPPTSIDISSLVALSNAYTGSTSCTRGDMFFYNRSGSTPAFYNSGSTCPLGMALKHPQFSSLFVTLPGDFRGDFQQVPTRSFEMKPEDVPHSPTMLLEESGNGVVYWEPVTSITGVTGAAGNGMLTFTGQKYYCAQIDWNRG